MVDAATKDLPQAVELTPRGKAVMELFMRGCTYKEIAERLGISISGVYRHRERMLLKNECKSMLELAVRYQTWVAAQQDETPITDSE